MSLEGDRSFMCMKDNDWTVVFSIVKNPIKVQKEFAQSYFRLNNILTDQGIDIVICHSKILEYFISEYYL